MKKKNFVDDGRRIADMSNIEDHGLSGSIKRLKTAKPETTDYEVSKEHHPTSKTETKAIIWNSILAAIVIAVIFLIGIVLFILFCIHIWLK